MPPNMVATVHITDLALDSALALPTSLVQQDAQGQDFVYVVRGDVAKKQTVEAGTMADGMLSSNRRRLATVSLTVAPLVWWTANAWGDRILSPNHE